MCRLLFLIALLSCLSFSLIQSQQRDTNVGIQSIQLSTILPKLNAIHEDAKSLLAKNADLKAKILVGLKAQTEAKLKNIENNQAQTPMPSQAQQPTQQPLLKPQQVRPLVPNGGSPIEQNSPDETIDYSELEQFNSWVSVNLNYAVRNTQASIDALKEEASQNSGMVEYSEQAVKDGIEGIKYWQSAVIFQDKTLKNEKFEIE